MVPRKLLAGEDFTDFSIKFADATTKLCEETYDATDDPPARPQLLKLIKKAKGHISEYHELLDAYTAGRRDAILEVANFIKALEGFTAKLEEIAQKKA